MSVKRFLNFAGFHNFLINTINTSEGLKLKQQDKEKSSAAKKSFEQQASSLAKCHH